MIRVLKTTVITACSPGGVLCCRNGFQSRSLCMPIRHFLVSHVHLLDETWEGLLLPWLSLKCSLPEPLGPISLGRSSLLSGLESPHWSLCFQGRVKLAFPVCPKHPQVCLCLHVPPRIKSSPCFLREGSRSLRSWLQEDLHIHRTYRSVWRMPGTHLLMGLERDGSQK